MSFKYKPRDFTEVLDKFLTMELTQTEKEVISNEIASIATYKYREYVFNQPMLSGIKKGKEFISFDNHLGEYDTHLLFAVEICTRG